jgi:hypothetical protein
MTGFDKFSVPICLAVFLAYPARIAAWVLARVALTEIGLDKEGGTGAKARARARKLLTEAIILDAAALRTLLEDVPGKVPSDAALGMIREVLGDLVRAEPKQCYWRETDALFADEQTRRKRIAEQEAAAKKKASKTQDSPIPNEKK